MKVYGIQTIDLGPGVSAEELEQTLRDGWASLPKVAGWHMYLLKGKYGQRVGEYVLLVEVDSLELRNQLYPPDGQYTPEVLAFLQAHPEVQAFEDARMKLMARLAGYSITDYVVVAENAPKAE
jgi:hypothetical protein